jgi:hypothetical protein
MKPLDERKKDSGDPDFLPAPIAKESFLLDN